jgi:hypothetical protein
MYDTQTTEHPEHGALVAACRDCGEVATQVDTPEDARPAAVGSPVCVQHARPNAPALTPASVDKAIAAAEFERAGLVAIVINEEVPEARRAEAHRVIDYISEHLIPLRGLYGRYRWQRWFLVQQHNGHLHTTTNCTTCFASTEFAWVTDISGWTEAEAVAEYGWMVCTVCVPGAPTLPGFNTPGRRAEADAEADGKCLNRTPANFRYHRNRWPVGDCETCGAKGVDVTGSGLRKHDHWANKVNAERAARLTDPKLIGTPAGDALRVDGETYKTVRSAEIAYVNAMTWTSDQARKRAAVLLEALAAKRGVTAEEATAQLAARVAKKRREYGY